ncbi:rRNA-processing protein EFG1 [Picochlorum sp. SENEW3]|nr:rRNA-processing protein EFG1 [Picochlorum sp. SENEW3]
MALDTKKMKKKKKTPSMTKRIRDVKRLLAKVRKKHVEHACGVFHEDYATRMQDTLDDKLRQVMEKRLRDLLEESEENRKKYLERKFAVRYHKIRFFERIKIERRLSKIKKGIKHASSEEEKENLLKRLAAVQEDLEYVLHFPKGEKYVSLLRDADTAEAQAHLESERKRLREIVKQKLRDDAIVNEPDEGVRKEGLVEHEEADRREDDEVIQGTGEDDLMNDDFFAQSSGSDDDVSVEDQGSPDSDILSSESEDLEDRMQPSKKKVEVVVDRRREVKKSRKEYSQQRQRPAKGKVNGSKMGGGKPLRSKGVQKKKIKPGEKQPLRTRAEGGRKRRKKK